MLTFLGRVDLCSDRGLVARIHADKAMRMFMDGQALIEYRDELLAHSDVAAVKLEASRKAHVIRRMKLPDHLPAREDSQYQDSRYTTRTETVEALQSFDESCHPMRPRSVFIELTQHKPIPADQYPLYRQAILENLVLC